MENSKADSQVGLVSLLSLMEVTLKVISMKANITGKENSLQKLEYPFKEISAKGNCKDLG